MLGFGFGDLSSAVLGAFFERLQYLGVCDIWGPVVLWGLCFLGVCSAQASVVFRGLWCSGLCAVWGLQCLRVCAPRGSVLLQALDFVSSPYPSLNPRSLLPAGVPVRFPAGASSSPFPPSDAPDRPSDVTSRRDPPQH